MKVLPPEVLPDRLPQMGDIESDMKQIFRMLIFSPELQATPLLKRYMEAIGHLRQVLSFKNAQQEAQSEAEARTYLAHLQQAMSMMVEEIRASRCLASAVDLFRLFRTVAPEAAARHPNHYRQTLVQVGQYLAPEPVRVPGLMEEVFARAPDIAPPLLRAIWMHHEIVRIHPFVDGNGRVGRMAKNWILMFELYPPIFIYGQTDRQRYIRYLGESFADLENAPETFHASTRVFFEDELRRVKASTGFLLARMQREGDAPFGPEDLDIRPYTS